MSEISDKLTALVAEVLSLRSQVSMPTPESGPQEVLNSLLDQRFRFDRMEELHINAMRIKGTVSREVSKCKALSDDAWSTALVEAKAASARQGEQFEGPRERYAVADLASLSYKRNLRKAEEMLSLAEETADVTRVALRGVSEVIQDHRTWLRALQFTTYLEK